MRTWGLLFSALLLAGGGCATSSEAPAAPEFFTLPMTAGAADPQPDLPTRPPREGEVQGYTIELLITRAKNAYRLQAPRLTVYAGQRANITIINQISFVQDFDVGRDKGVEIADPIIGIIQEGLVVDLVAKPTEDGGRVALLFSIVQSELQRPIRVQKVRIGSGTPVQIQLPSLVSSQIAGSSVVPAGVESFLTQIPGPEGALDVTVRAVPVALPRMIEHAGEQLEMKAGGGAAPEAEATQEARMRRKAFEQPQAPETGWLRISLLRLDAGKRIREPAYMQRTELKRRLTALSPETLKTFVIPAGSVSGTEADFILQRSYVSGYEVQTGNTTLGDPVIDTFRVGFEATLVRDDEGAALQYGWSTLKSMESYTTTLGPAQVTFDLPEIVGRTGKLALRADANLTPVADLKDGRSIALLVERVPDP